MLNLPKMQRKRSINQYETDDIQICSYCFAGNDDGCNSEVYWVGCDKCELWYHSNCIEEAQYERPVHWDKENLICATCVAGEKA